MVKLVRIKKENGDFMKARQFLILSTVLLLFLSSCSTFEKDKSQKSTDSEVINKDIIRILVVGVDSRGERKSRSDSILYVQYHPYEEKVKVVSFMRDSYVDIPGYEWNKLNQAYFYGGIPLLEKTIKKNFGVTFDHHAVIDFQAFSKIVDSVAPEGIEVELTQNIIDNMALPYTPGKVTLHGEELLKYARFRHDATSDFGRVERQQYILEQITTKISDKLHSLVGIGDLFGVWHNSKEYVDTSISGSDILKLGTSTLFTKMPSVETLRIPTNGSFQDQAFEHAGMVLQLDFEKNQNVLKEFLQETKQVSK